MKALKLIFALLLMTSLYACGDDDGCKVCTFEGDSLGELCDDRLKVAQENGASCR
ncbi:hypothetical protein ACFOUP_01885 [Belliella kenyensis]|uniref:Lipoprotein n=1 Tax=Belliella kenyensis TaxID=1472724 RepID=A0ABV8EHL1_9BACT|nr:hypothetical protein [Belliella kenyensis]MCH7401054.1 hypothetical protein [Belliella kenyensis]MDN3604052.1 hypothetical protein [Belliella kenyensis]